MKNLDKLEKSRYYELLRNTFDRIAKYCFISHVSKRDKIAQKNYGIIFRAYA